MLSEALTKAKDQLDRTLAFLGMLFSVVLTLWVAVAISNVTYVIIGTLIFLACAIYLILRRNLSPSTIRSLVQLRASSRFYIVSNILFFLLFSYSIVSVLLRPDPYVRPLEYFVSTALITAILAVEILFLSPRKLHIYSVLFKIVLIGLSLEWSLVLLFPSVVGIDPWAHQWFTLKILNDGHIPAGYEYSQLPLMHLMIGVTSLVTGLGYKMSTMFSISLLQVVCDSLFVFLLGRYLLGTKIGLLGALLLAVANNHVNLGYWTIPNTAAAILILPIVYLLFKTMRKKPLTAVSLSILLMAALILTHTITGVCLTILLFVFWAGFQFRTRLYNEKNPVPIILAVPVFFAVGMLAYWTYVSGHLTLLANLIKSGFSTQSWVHGPLVEESIRYMSSIPLWEKLFVNLGMFLFFAISFVGCFYMISKRFGTSHTFVLAIGGMAVLALGVFPSLIGSSFIEHRWEYFGQIMLAVPLALSLTLLCNVFKKNLAKGLSISFLVFALAFLMIMSPQASLDNTLLSPNSGVRYAFTGSELRAMDTVSKIWNGTIGADYLCADPYLLQLNHTFTYIDKSLYSGNFSDCKEMVVLVRKELLTRPFYTSSGTLRLNYDPCVALDEQVFSRIYDCGSINAYAGTG